MLRWCTGTEISSGSRDVQVKKVIGAIDAEAVLLRLRLAGVQEHPVFAMFLVPEHLGIAEALVPLVVDLAAQDRAGR